MYAGSMKADEDCNGPITWDTVGADKMQKQISVTQNLMQQTRTLKVVGVDYTNFQELFEGMGEQLFSLAGEEVHVHLFPSSEL